MARLDRSTLAFIVAAAVLLAAGPLLPKWLAFALMVSIAKALVVDRRDRGEADECVRGRATSMIPAPLHLLVECLNERMDLPIKSRSRTLRDCLGIRRRRAGTGFFDVRQEPTAADAGSIGEDRQRNGGGTDPLDRPARISKQSLGP